MLDDLEKIGDKKKSEITTSILMMEKDIQNLNKQLKAAKEKSDTEGQEDIDEEMVQETFSGLGKQICYARAIMDFVPNGLLLLHLWSVQRIVLQANK